MDISDVIRYNTSHIVKSVIEHKFPTKTVIMDAVHVDSSNAEPIGNHMMTEYIVRLTYYIGDNDMMVDDEPPRKRQCIAN